MESLRKKLTDSFRLSNDEWSMVSDNINSISLQKGDFFIEQGKLCRNSGFILDGVIRYFSYDEKGNDPTCYFGYETFYITDPFTFKKQELSEINLQAVTPCEIAVISFDSHQKLQHIFPRWNDICNQLLLEVSMDFANQKGLLAMNAAERYDYFTEKYPTVVRRVPLQYVASYLGIAQPSLSRIRKNMR